MNERITKPSAPLFGSNARTPARPAKPLPAPNVEPENPGRTDPPDRPTVVSTKLPGPLVAKLDRIRKAIGGVTAATRSAALRWIVEQHKE